MEGKLHIMMVISMILPFAKLAFAIPDTFTLGVSRLFLFFGGGASFGLFLYSKIALTLPLLSLSLYHKTTCSHYQHSTTTTTTLSKINTDIQSQTIKQVWAKRSAVNIIDSHKDYLNDISRIASPDYKPTTQDILISRVRTTQVIMEKYRIDGIDFEVYDVGGQRSERRKWIDCFDSVTAVIFVAALSEYDQSLAEAKRTNRMVEALELFRSVCNNRAFANTSIMLFLNKKDIFMEKILYSDIAAQRPFCDYAGPTKDSDHGVLYFIQKFKDCLIDDEFNDSFIHVTCATDTNNMEFVLESTRTIIMTDVSFVFDPCSVFCYIF